LLNALLYYLQVLERKVELKKELEIWEKTSEIDLVEKIGTAFFAEFRASASQLNNKI